MRNKLIFLFLSLAFLPACINFGGGLQFSYNLSSVGEGIAPSDSEYFYIDLDIDKYKSAENLVPYYEISTTTEYGDAEKRDSLSNCEIFYDSDSEDEDGERVASEEPLICILDLLEYDLKVKETHITYNFPEGMCDYIETSLPWHFNAEILPGPVVYEKEVPKGCGEGGGSEGEGDTEECKKYWCDSIRDNCILQEDGNEEKDLCPIADTWKYVGDEDVRCCHGGAKLDDSEWEPDIRCFGGPALVAEMEGHERSRFNETQIRISPENGFKDNIKLPNLVSEIRPGQYANNTSGSTSVSVPVANYLEILDRSPDKLKKLNEESLPVFLQDSLFYDKRPRLFFEFSCLDSGGEVLHKILMMIREWNTNDEFRDFYDDGGNDSADPDVEGIEGSSCKYEGLSILAERLDECNDLLDFDDVVNCDRYAWCSTFHRESDIFKETTAIYPRIAYPTGTLEKESTSSE